MSNRGFGLGGESMVVNTMDMISDITGMLEKGIIFFAMVAFAFWVYDLVRKKEEGVNKE